MSHRLIFTNTPSINKSLSAKYVVGSGVGSRNRSVYRALQRRSNNNAQGTPCCNNQQPICGEIIDISTIATDNGEGIYTLNGEKKFRIGWRWAFRLGNFWFFWNYNKL